MNKFKYLLLVAVAAFCFATSPQKAKASGQISVQIGAAPLCPYGYFDYPPYDCAPYGYYGPEWFSSGVFIGAGPWYRGPAHFWGHVDNHYDRHDGWHGEYPPRGEHFDAHHHPEHVEHFNGNEKRDGRGHSDHGANHEHGDHGHDHDHGH